MYVQVLQVSQRMNAANLYVDLAVCAYCLLPQMILTMTHCLGAYTYMYGNPFLPQIRFDRAYLSVDVRTVVPSCRRRDASKRSVSRTIVLETLLFDASLRRHDGTTVRTSTDRYARSKRICGKKGLPYMYV